MRSRERTTSDGEKIELRPDGWERFRSAVHAAAKNGPMHRAPKPKARRRKKKA